MRPVSLLLFDNKVRQRLSCQHFKRLIEDATRFALSWHLRFLAGYGRRGSAAKGQGARRGALPAPAAGEQGENNIISAPASSALPGRCRVPHTSEESLAGMDKGRHPDGHDRVAMPWALSSFFTKTSKSLAARFVKPTSECSSGDQDFTAQLADLIARIPMSKSFMPAYFAEGAIIMKQARELGAKFRLMMGADAMDNPDTVKLGGKAVERIHCARTYAYDPAMQDMSARRPKSLRKPGKSLPQQRIPMLTAPLAATAISLIARRHPPRAGKDDPEAIARA